MRLAGLPEYTVDWQHLTCLLYVLDEMGGEYTRYEITEFIRARHYLHLEPIDRTPYDTQIEERWRTDIAYARKIGVISELVSYNSRNSWGITRRGREAIRLLVSRGSEIQVHRCFLWSTDFKRIFLPSHMPSIADHLRPERWTKIVTPDPILLGVADMLLVGDHVPSMLEKLSAKLGFTVAANRVSLAFAMQEYKRMKEAGLCN